MAEAIKVNLLKQRILEKLNNYDMKEDYGEEFIAIIDEIFEKPKG